MRLKLLDLLQQNTLRIFITRVAPLDVDGIYWKIREAFPDEDLTLRTLYNWLKEFVELGICDKIAKNRYRYYYLKGGLNPAFFWKEILEPSLHMMRVDNGMTCSGSFILGKEKRPKNKPELIVGIPFKAAILEAGIDITSMLPEEEVPRDILGQFFNSIDFNIRKELYLRYNIRKTSSGEKFEEISHEKLEELKNQLKGKKLAIIFFLDASEFLTQVLPPKDEEAFKKWWNKILEQKSKEIRRIDRYFRQSPKNC